MTPVERLTRVLLGVLRTRVSADAPARKLAAAAREALIALTGDPSEKELRPVLEGVIYKVELDFEGIRWRVCYSRAAALEFLTTLTTVDS